MIQKIKFEKNLVEKKIKTGNIGKKELAATPYHRISCFFFYPPGTKFKKKKKKKTQKKKKKKDETILEKRKSWKKKLAATARQRLPPPKRKPKFRGPFWKYSGHNCPFNP